MHDDSDRLIRAHQNSARRGRRLKRFAAIARSKAFIRSVTLGMLTVGFAADTTDALALTPWSQHGSTGAVYLFRNPSTGVMPQVRCNWQDGTVQPLIDLPG